MDKDRQMKELKKVIKDIRKKLDAKVFVTEEQVRLSLVARICQVLGWDIWNPAEFNTEYFVKKLKGTNGSVDIALFHSDKKPEAAQVFIETKIPGKLTPRLIAKWEEQLKQYNGQHSVAIGIITDGITWRLYAPSIIGGTIDNNIFAVFNILSDDIDGIVKIFKDVLHRNVSRMDALVKAQEMHLRLKKIKLVQSVKPKAMEMARATKRDMFLIAKDMLDNHPESGIDISSEEINDFWNQPSLYTSDQKSRKIKSKSSAATSTPKQRVKSKSTPALTGSTSYDNCVNVSIDHDDIDAWGCYNVKTGEFTLCRGSQLLKKAKSELQRGNADLRNEMINKGFLMCTPDGKKYVLTEDYPFREISPATAMVLDRQRGGYERWLDEKGKKLNSRYEPSDEIKSKMNAKGKSISRNHPECTSSFVKVYMDESEELTATGHYDPDTEKITVYRGSEAKNDHDPAVTKIHVDKKDELIKNKILLPHPKKKKLYIFIEDCTLEDPTQASSIVLGRRSQGYALWFDENGNKLRKHKK